MGFHEYQASIHNGGARWPHEYKVPAVDTHKHESLTRRPTAQESHTGFSLSLADVCDKLALELMPAAIFIPLRQ